MQGRKPVGVWGTEGMWEVSEQEVVQWKEDQRLSGSPIKVPLTGRAPWCPLFPTSVTRQMLVVKSSKFQPPAPDPRTYSQSVLTPLPVINDRCMQSD